MIKVRFSFQKWFSSICLRARKKSPVHTERYHHLDWQASRYVRAWMLSRIWLCDPMDCSPPGPSVHGISQARILEWVPISFSRGSSWPRDQTHISCIAADSLPLRHWGSPSSYLQPLISSHTNHRILFLGIIIYITYIITYIYTYNIYNL